MCTGSLWMRNLDIGYSEAAVEDCGSRFPLAHWQAMSVTDLAFATDSFDMVNCRHGYIWLNRYAPGPFEELLDSLSMDMTHHDVTTGSRTDRVYLCTKQAA